MACFLWYLEMLHCKFQHYKLEYCPQHISSIILIILFSRPMSVCLLIKPAFLFWRREQVLRNQNSDTKTASFLLKVGKSWIQFLVQPQHQIFIHFYLFSQISILTFNIEIKINVGSYQILQNNEYEPHVFWLERVRIILVMDPQLKFVTCQGLNLKLFRFFSKEVV